MQEIYLKLNSDDLGILNKALIQMPYGEVVALIEKINKQLSEQLQPSHHENEQ